MMQYNITCECIFSNWILLWTILYAIDIKNVPSPFYFLITGIIVNLIFAIYLIYCGTELIYIFAFLVSVSIFKLFPALIIKKPNNYDGIYFGIFLLMAYTLYFLYKFKLKGIIEIIKSNPGLSSTSVSIGNYLKKFI